MKMLLNELFMDENKITLFLDMDLVGTPNSEENLLSNYFRKIYSNFSTVISNYNEFHKDNLTKDINGDGMRTLFGSIITDVEGLIQCGSKITNTSWTTSLKHLEEMRDQLNNDFITN